MNILQTIYNINFLLFLIAITLLSLLIILSIVSNPNHAYKYLFDFQLLISAFIAPSLAVIGWWVKVIYEKWSGEKKAISELQQTYSHNLDTIPRLIEVLTGLSENVSSNSKQPGQYEHYKNHIEYLNEANAEAIRSLRNIDLLNNIFKSNIFIKRFNALFKKIFEEYNLITEKYKSDLDFSSLKISSRDLNDVIISITEMGSLLEIDFKTSLANLRCAGDGISKSVFYKLERVSVYNYTLNEVEESLKEINKEQKH